MGADRKLLLDAVAVLALLSVCLMAGCAAKKDMTKGPGRHLDLEYRLAEGEILKYRIESGFVQSVEVMGRSVEVTADEIFEFSVKSEGKDEGNLKLLITMDAMDIDIVTPQGSIQVDVSRALGKSFGMSVSPLGEEVDIEGAGDLVYDMGAQGSRSIESQFSAFFPDLPGRSTGIDGAWKSRATITELTSSGELNITIDNENTLKGFETVEGLECAKIEAPFTGTLSGSGEEGGVELITNAKMKGMSTWYFAYQEGIYVKEVSTGTAEGTVTAMTAEKMEIPLKRDFKIEVTLLK